MWCTNNNLTINQLFLRKTTYTIYCTWLLVMIIIKGCTTLYFQVCFGTVTNLQIMLQPSNLVWYATQCNNI